MKRFDEMTAEELAGEIQSTSMELFQLQLRAAKRESDLRYMALWLVAKTAGVGRSESRPEGATGTLTPADFFK